MNIAYINPNGDSIRLSISAESGLRLGGKIFFARKENGAWIRIDVPAIEVVTGNMGFITLQLPFENISIDNLLICWHFNVCSLIPSVDKALVEVVVIQEKESQKKVPYPGKKPDCNGSPLSIKGSVLLKFNSKLDQTYSQLWKEE